MRQTGEGGRGEKEIDIDREERYRVRDREAVHVGGSLSGVPASTLALVPATVLAAVRSELRDLWDPAGEHRLHTHNHPFP